MQALINKTSEADNYHPIHLVVIDGKKESKTISFPLPNKKAIIIGITFALFQVLDGILTHMGISRFGMQAEYNFFLREMMMTFDPVFVLATLKFCAILVIAFLTLMSARVHWIINAMASLTFLYLVAAIIPWTVMLFLHHIA